MRILVVGDFHGKFPMKIKKKITKEDIDLIVSIGDYFPWSFKKEFFKYCYKTDKELWEILGKGIYKKGFLEDLSVGENILKNLNSSKTPVVTVVGNYDSHNYTDDHDVKKSKWAWINQDFFSMIIKKYSNIKRIDYGVIKIGGIVLIGAYGGSFPGKVKSKAYRKYRKKLDNLFKKYQKENVAGKVIFVSHNVPYGSKFSKIGKGKYKGVEKGSKLIRRIIDRYQPTLSLCGHMHEHQGKIRIGKTVIVNSGAVLEGKCALINFDEIGGKVKSVEFVG